MGKDQDWSGLIAQLEKAGQPFNARLQSLENKMDMLYQDRVTRTDISNLRSELTGSLVPINTYRPEHAALVEKDAQLSAQLNQYRTDMQADMQRITNMLESLKLSIDQKIEKAQEATLSSKDRAWIRTTQVVSFISAFLSTIAVIATIIAVVTN